MDQIDPKECMYSFFTNMVKHMQDYELIALKRACLKEITTRNNEAMVVINDREFPPLNAEEKELVNNYPINAIKTYRSRVGCMLKEAKDVIEHYRFQCKSLSILNIDKR